MADAAPRGELAMDPMLLRLFQRQVQFQCQTATAAMERLKTSLATLQDCERDSARAAAASAAFWMSVQEFLAAAANISKALWGQQAATAKARLPLRRSLGVRATSPLHERTMRHNFEHFDERIDRWWAESANHNIGDFIIGPMPGSIQGLPAREIFRAYDPTTQDVVFWGERFNLQELGDAIGELLPRASAEAAKPHWETGVR